MQIPKHFTNPHGWLNLKVSQCHKSLPIIFTSISCFFSNTPPPTNSGQLRSPDLRQVHAFVLKTTTFPDPPPPNLLSQPKLFSSPEAISYFCFILNHLDSPELSVHLCNAVIRSRDCGDSRLSMVFFREMVSNGFVPDRFTVPFVLKACAQFRSIREGVQIQAYSVKTGLMVSNVYVRNTVMRLYAVCGFVESVRQLFDESPRRDLISWTTLIQCYVKMGFSKEGVKAFFKMRDAKVKADEMTVVVVLSACANIGDLSLGEKIHAYIHHKKLNLDVFVGNALVDMYLKCGDAESAWKIFDSMPTKNVVSWNSLISGMAHLGQFKEALFMFRKMQREGIQPDDVTLVCVLNSCANIGMLELGKWVHTHVDRNRIEADGFIGNALVDMYSKCGSIDQAIEVFEGMKRRDVYTYTSIIVGLAMHGEAEKALAIFHDMNRTGVKPDEVTFIGILTACSHSGLVAEGKKYFKDMSSEYNLKPQTIHYGCMVDLLGRAGLIEEAEELIGSMPMEPDGVVLGALLGACKIYGQVELGEEVMKKLLEAEPEKDGAYILMSNIYSSANKWRDAVKLRKMMKKKKVKRIPGCSSIVMDGVVHEFRKGDKSNPRSKEIYEVLEGITQHLKNNEHLSHQTA